MNISEKILKKDLKWLMIKVTAFEAGMCIVVLVLCLLELFHVVYHPVMVNVML